MELFALVNKLRYERWGNIICYVRFLLQVTRFPAQTNLEWYFKNNIETIIDRKSKLQYLQPRLIHYSSRCNSLTFSTKFFINATALSFITLFATCATKGGSGNLVEKDGLQTKLMLYAVNVSRCVCQRTQSLELWRS